MRCSSHINSDVRIFYAKIFKENVNYLLIVVGSLSKVWLSDRYKTAIFIIEIDRQYNHWMCL